MKSTKMMQMQKVRDLARRLFGHQQIPSRPELPHKVLKGIHNEQRAFCLIDKILKEVDIFPLASRPYISPPYSTEDLDGYDIVIPTDKGKTGIQIKSSDEFVIPFQAKQPHIPVVVVNDEKPDTRLKIELTSALRQAYNQLLEGRVQID